MNPGVSLQLTGDLFILVVSAVSVEMVDEDVTGVAMISTSFIAVKGLGVDLEGNRGF
jgi:hypothetical protein